MADSILRLKVESQEYDAKLKRASQGLQQYVDGCRKVGGTLEVVEKDTLDFVRAIGQMESTAKGAKSSLAEMTKTFTDLSAQYNKLTDAEKSSPFGQALKGSLDELRGRIQDSNAEIKNITDSLNGGSGGLSGALDTVAGKFGMSVGQLASWGTALGAAKVALDVMKDAFFNNEEQLDEWGRIVESSESVYSAFLNSINTGDISGFLSRIGEITKAARDAYDALDELGTFNAFNQVNVEKTRTGMTESIADYRGGNGSKEQVKASGEAYKKELEERRKLEQKAYLAKIKEVAAQRGVSAKDLTDALSGTYGNYQDLKNVQPTGQRTVFYGGGMFGGGGSYTEKFAQNDRERLGEALRHLNDTELQSLQALGAQAQRTGNEIATVDKQLTRVLNGKTPGSGGGGGGKGSKSLTPEQQTAKTIQGAEQEYARAIEKARIEVESGTATTADQKKAEYRALESLWTAYSKAADTVPSNETYRQRMTELEASIKTLGGEVTQTTAAQEAAKKAAQELAQKQKKQADALDAMLAAAQGNNLGDFYKAQQQYRAAGGTQSTGMAATATTGNIDAFIKNLKDQIAGADLGSDLYNALTAQLADVTTLQTIIKQMVDNGIRGLDGFDPQEFWSKIFGDNPGDFVENQDWQAVVDKINEKLKEMQLDPIKIDFNTGNTKNQAKDMANDWKSAASAIQQVGSAMSAIEDPAAKVVGTIAQAIASIALGFGQAAKGPYSSPWEYIAFIAAGTATMISAIASIHSATSGNYASGGIIPGNSFSGDNLRMPVDGGRGMIGVNSGELILNRAQQNSIASQLEGNAGLGNLQLSATISGEQIRLALNNNSRRRGKGEYVTSNFR